ncbi:MAG: DNA-directed RNA polymerase subunit alpha C-terminal domain-containing protein [Planctomycetota bacterium]
MTTTTHRPQLDQPLTSLPLSARARRALDQLQVATVAEFVLTPRERFLALPGCGARTCEELERKVTQWLAERVGDPDAMLEDQRPLQPLLDDPDVAAALDELGVRTVGEFLALPRAEAQKHPALGKRRWQRLYDAILRTRRLPPAAAPLLPDTLRRLPLSAIGLPQALSQQLLDLGCTTVGHALLLPAGLYDDGGLLGTSAALAVRTGLDQLFRIALEQLEDQDPDHVADWQTLRGRLLAPLDDGERDWLCLRIGLGMTAHAPRDLRLHEGIAPDQVAARDHAVRARLAERAPTVLGRLRHEVLRELDAFEGVVRSDRLAVGSWLHTMAKDGGDPLLPLRLMAFCFPTELYLHGELLTTLPPRVWLQFQRQLRTAAHPRQLPRPLEEIAHHLQAVIDPVPRGLLLHLLGDTLRLRVLIDPERGELVQSQQPALASRLADLLHERGRPTRFEDLLFDYRERFRAARPQRLLTQLRADETFLQIGAETWSLRDWHGDELRQVMPEAERVVQLVCQRGGKQRIAEHCGDNERSCHMLVDLVRRDRRLRYLGRGEVCPAGHGQSQVLHDLLRDFKKAMGEVPMSRFVHNQPPEKRRLVERLLFENRLFVLPAPDRIDVLTNYPFNQERLHRLTVLVDDLLVQRNGYAPLDVVLAEVNRCDLGGSWLHPTLLGELLRRHGPFEVLPGGFVARSALGLGGWLMRRARNALREAAVPITVAELLAERPELAEFAPCLEQLLNHDPLVQTPDGNRFQIA